MRILICEIFEEFAKAVTKDQRIAVLRKYESEPLKTVLRNTYHPHIVYLVDRVPAYKPSPFPRGMTGNNIGKELKMVYLFQRGNPKRPPALTEKRMLQILTQILEGLEKDEAPIFMNMLLKDLRVPGLDAALVQEAFPGLLN
jgi:hypothetical protein